MRIVTWSLVLVVAGTAAIGSQPAPDPMTDLRSYVERFTGAQPADCGQHAIGPTAAGTDAAQTSVTCATASAKEHKPFWTLKRQQGIDSQVFEGLLGTAEGLIYRFSYDSAPCGGPGCSGQFSIQRCQKPAAPGPRDGGTFFRCER